MESIATLDTTIQFQNAQNEEGNEELEPLISIQDQQFQIDEHCITITQQIEHNSASSIPDETKGESENPFNNGDIQEPVHGMEFESPDAARAFYSAYAKKIGFSVRNSKSFTSRVDDTVIMRRFVCSKQGMPTKKDPFDLTKKRRNRVSSREGCKAMLQVNRRENGLWSVSRCVLEHCHPLGMVSKASLASQKKQTKKPWELIPPSHTIDSQQNGLGPGGGVAQSLLEYFKKMQAENPSFFYAIQLDSNNCITNIFWADSKARMAYRYFGDTVTFDMTCKKNKRAIPFASFTGVNHHRQVIVFGCAFMTCESETSFTWLFETWLNLMGDRKPVSFVVAWNDAIFTAASHVFHNVCLRICKRDIFSKCKEKLANVYALHYSFKNDFKACVNESECIEEFELAWKCLIERYNLEEDLWLSLLFDMREKWVPAYFRGVFFADMPRAQKLETMHKFFQRHSITTTTLRDLVTQFDKSMTAQYENEIQLDLATINNRPVLKTPSHMEKQVSEIYTRTIFDLFQEELVESLGLLMDKIEGEANKYRVWRAENYNKSYVVSCISSEKKISCTCQLFEFFGILCRHILKVLPVIGIVTLPKEYILGRWTKNAKCSMMLNENCDGANSNCIRALSWRCNDLCRDAIRFAEEGATSAAIYKIAKEVLQNAFNEIFAAKSGSLSSATR